MKIAIVGGGIVGLTSAYFLAREGCEIVLVDREPELVTQASAANAGLIAPGHSFAWASPSAPKQLVQSLFGAESSISVERLDLPLLGWGMKFLRQCTPSRARENTLVKMRLALEGQRLLERTITDEGIECHYVDAGVLYLYRSQKEFAAGIAKMQLVRDHGIEMRELTSSQISDVEPALASAAGVYSGALHSPSDTTADCASFAQALLKRCEALGVEVQTSTEARRLLWEKGAVSGVHTDSGDIFADRVVVSAGAWSSQLLAQEKVSLPIYPAKGYVIDVPMSATEVGPILGGLDERTLVAWSRKGSKLRMSASAQFDGYERGVSEAALKHMVRTGREAFGDALEWDRLEAKVGLRPMTPDGPPIIGSSRLPNLFYNTGHGHMGWTMSCASAVILRDSILGRTPELAIAGVDVRSRRW